MSVNTAAVLMPSRPPLDWPTYLTADWPISADPATTALGLGQHHIDKFGMSLGALPGSAVNSFTIGAAMIAALARSGSPIDPSREALTSGEAEARLGDYLIDSAAGIQPPGLEDSDRALAYLIGSLSSQLVLQIPIAAKQVLMMHLLGWAGPTPDAGTSFIDLAGATGGVEVALFTSALLLAHGRTSPYVNGPDSLAGLKGTRISADAVQAVLEDLRLDVSHVRRVAEVDLHLSAGLDTRTVAFWLANPLIHLGSGHYVLAPAAFLMDALMIGLVLRVMEKDLDPTSANPGHLTRLFGTRFERYVGDVLAAAESASSIQPEIVVCRSKGREFRSPDYLLWESGSPRSLLAIETKLHGFDAPVFAGADLGAFRGRMIARFVPSVLQAVKAIFRMVAAAKGGSATPEGRELCDRVLASREFTVAVVVPFFPTPLNAAPIFNRFDPELISQARAAELKDQTLSGLTDWLEAHRVAKTLRYLWMSAADLEQHSGWRGAPSLVRVLAEFATESAARGLVPAKGVGFAATLSDWMRSRGCPGGLSARKRDLAGSFWTTMKHRAYGPDAAG